MLYRCVRCVVLNDTGTAEIYTYGDSLSLHDALPISAADAGALHAARRQRRRRRAAPRRRDAQGRGLAFRDRGKRRRAAARAHHRERRSEEHTSELQSLMRISYAVFCWKKKKTEHSTQLDEQDTKNRFVYTSTD